MSLWEQNGSPSMEGDFESQVISGLAGDPWDTLPREKSVAFHFLSYKLEVAVYL